MTFATNILAPLDFSDASAHALSVAKTMARQNRARLTVMHVVPTEPLQVEAGELEQPLEGPRELEAAVHDHLDRVRAELREELPDVKTLMARGTNEALAICEAAEDGHFDLIVIATHGAKGLSRLLLGSVTESVVRHAPCAVLVVRVPKPPTT